MILKSLLLILCSSSFSFAEIGRGSNNHSAADKYDWQKIRKGSLAASLFSEIATLDETKVSGYGQKHPVETVPYCSNDSSISFSSYPPSVWPQRFAMSE